MIYFYDLGVYNGAEIDMFIKIAGELNQDYRVVGFEAHPWYSESLVQKFKKNPKVRIENLMISDKTGKEPLWISTAKEGHSKYPGKRNATKDLIMVDSIKFSSYVDIELFRNQFNIIRFNIEGAEWDFINDMIDSGLHKYVKLWLGAKAGEDILKCSEIKHLYNDYLKLLKDNNIFIHRFIYWGENDDLKQLILNCT